MVLFGLFNGSKKPALNEKMFHEAVALAAANRKKVNSKLLVVSDLQIEEILNRLKRSLKNIPYKTLRYDKLGDAAAILTNLNPSEIFIFYNIEEVSISESETIANAISHSKLVLDIQRSIDAPIRYVEFDLVKFSTILIMKSGTAISEKLFNCFETKIYLGSGANISLKTNLKSVQNDESKSSLNFQNVGPIKPNGDSKMSKISEISLVDPSNLNFDRYLSSTTDETIDASIVSVTLKNSEGNYHIFGAYYGYCGGGTNDGGYFHIDLENDIANTLDYSEVDEIGEEAPNSQALLNALMQAVWLPIADKEDVLNISDFGKKLFQESDNNQLYISENFDTDLLSAISNKWLISTRFES